MYTLYVIAVPIGNIKEITVLAKEKLEEIKTIFCEDTRVTNKLLSFLNITGEKNLLQTNQFNESEQFEKVIELLEYQDCALVSDAGYPVISDPGYFLIKKLRQANMPVQVINGPCAFIHAVVGSGVDSRKLFWANFLNKKPLKRKQELQKLLKINREATIVYYEPTAFLEKGLKLIREVFGDIKIVVCRELSKKFETFYHDTITELLKTVKQTGEFVIIIPLNDKVLSISSTDELIEKMNELVVKKQLPIKTAGKVYSNNEHTSSELYDAYIKKYKN